MSTPHIQLSIIVLFYHGERWIEGCMQSLETQSLLRSKYEIILVDNGGSTPSVENYSEKPGTKVLHFKKNYGFTGGNNRALPHADGRLILLMNQDVVVHFNCLEALLAAFQINPKAGVISANMLMFRSNSELDLHKRPGGTAGFYKLSRLGYASYVTEKTQKEMIPVEFVSGNAMCFRKDILSDIKNYLFDDRLVSYAEDLDLSIRLNKTSWKMYVRPQALVYHHREDSFSGKPLDQLRKLTHISSNRLLVYYNNLPFRKFLTRLPALLLGIPLKVARPDGSPNFHFFNFLVAFIFVPIILVNFCLRSFQQPKMEEVMGITAKDISNQL